MDEPQGRAKGGRARAERLPAERRREIGRQGAQARKELAALPKATHGSADHPLKVGDIEIPAYVLDNETRVLSQRGLHAGIGVTVGGDPSGEARIVAFVKALEQKGLNTNDLTARLRNPIRFQPPGGGRSAYGYDATILACAQRISSYVQTEALPKVTRSEALDKLLLACYRYLMAEHTSNRNAACAWLQSYLSTGERSARQLKLDAWGAGIGETTLWRAKTALGIVSKRRGGYAGAGNWMWSLPALPERDDSI